MPGKHFDLDTDVLLGGESSSDITIASQKATKTYIDTKNSGKQDKLTAGNNIKIENNVISVDGVSAELSELTDTTITNPTDGQGLIYNKTTNKWENKNIEVPSKTSELTNDSGFITKAVNNLENYTTTTALNTALDKKAEKEHAHTKSDITDFPTNVSEFTNDAGYLTEHQDISGKQDVINAKNKLGADLVDDSASTNKFVTESEKTAWSGKQDKIVDLETIRSNASKGATAVQPDDLASVATSGDYKDLTNVPTKVSEFTNDAGYLTGSDISSVFVYQGTKATVEELPATGNKKGDVWTVTADGAEYVWNGTAWEYLGETLDLSGYQTLISDTNKLNADLVDDSTATNKFVTASEKSTWSGKQDNIADLADIRTNASAGADAANTIAGYGDVVTHNASEFAKASHGHIITDITDLQTTLNGKQNTIADLETIRSNASEGKTANDTIATYGDIVTHNASEFLTEHQDISGKQDKITSTNKLSSDLVDDSTATNKFVTAAEKTTWNGKQDKIDDLETIRTNAANGAALSTQVNTNKEDIAGIKTDLNNYLPLSGGTITGDISPNLDNTVSLGTDALRFKEIYAHELKLSTNSLYLGDTKILGTDANTINIKADAGQSLALKSQGSGLTNVQSFTGVTIETIAENGTNPDGSIIKLKALGDGSSISMIAPSIGITGATTVSNLTVTGNLNVGGTTTTISSQNLEVKDNIIEINKGETGAGVSKGTAGIKIDRGEKTDFFIVYDETDTKLKAGIGEENVKAIATEEFVTNITDLKLDATATATSAAKLTTNAGNATQPVYFNNGVPVATTYTLNANVPADAKFTDTTYTASNGVTITGTNITNSGVRSVTAGTSNGTIKVDTNGTATEVAVTGLGSAAYTSSDAYATATHGHAIADVTGLQDSLDGKQANITSTNKLSADLLADGTTNKVVTATEKTTWNAKQNAISDLDTIRTNASAGKGAADTIATYGDIVSHNAVDFAEAVHTHEIADVNGLQTSLNGKQATITSTNKLSADLLAEGTTNKLVSATEKAAWSGKQDALSTTQIENIAKGGTAVQPEDLATVATSGSYNDLTNKPTIPSAVTETTVSDWGFTKNTGTVTSVTINGTAKNPTNGVVDLGTVITEHQDISGKQDVISDLDAIRAGASAGATALQSVPAEYVTETELEAKGYLTEHQDISGKQDAITSTNKLSADLIADGTTNKVVTDTEKSTWNAKQDTISDLATIRSGASAGATAVQPEDLATVATSGSYDDLADKPTIPTVNDATISIQKNGVAVDSFTANQASAKTINITVPTTAADVSALPDSTKYGYSFDLSMDSDTYVVSLTMKDQDGTAIGTAQTIDLPLESVIVSGSYDNTNKKIVLTLQSGSTVDVPVGDLIAGLQTEITSANKLSADLIADGTTNKVVTATEKTAWNNKQDTISDLATIRSGAGLGATAVQPADLATVATSGSYADLSNKPTIPTVTDTYSATSTNAMSGKAVASAISNKMDKGTLATVATSGSYNDLSDKPTIPSAVTETTVSGWGFTKNAGTITGIKMNGASKGTSGVIDLGTVLTAHQDLSAYSKTANTVSAVAAGSTANVIAVTKNGTTSNITINNVANATTASKLGSTTVGGTTTPIYLNNGTPTALSYTIAKSVPANAVFTDTKYTAGTGLSLSGTTLNHASSITAGTAGTSSATSGATLAVPYVTYNASGHVTAAGTHTHTITGFRENDFSRIALNQCNATNKYLKLATFKGNAASGNQDVSAVFSMDIIGAANEARAFALIALSARWSATGFTGIKFEIIYSYGAKKAWFTSNLKAAYKYTAGNSAGMVIELWLENGSTSYVTTYLRPVSLAYGDYGMAEGINGANWTYVNVAGAATSIAATAMTSGYTTLAPTNVGFATISHTQASNTINALTGYTKAKASAAISASDSLNTALGKLEYKCENATVSKILVGMIP